MAWHIVHCFHKCKWVYHFLLTQIEVQPIKLKKFTFFYGLVRHFVNTEGFVEVKPIELKHVYILPIEFKNITFLYGLVRHFLNKEGFVEVKQVSVSPLQNSSD